METLDVRDLPETDVRFLQQLIEFLRQKHRHEPTRTHENNTIELRSWSLGVKGNLSREEIYDYLDTPTNGAG